MIAVLFAKKKSIYKGSPGLDVWDKARDARKWPGGCAVIAHPPCAQWSVLKAFAKKDEYEKSHAVWAVAQVRRWGGVLEHPYGSELWDHCLLPKPGQFPDEFGGYSITVDQCHWDHPARKRTWLYIVGCPADALPPKPAGWRQPTHTIEGRLAIQSGLIRLKKMQRDITPPAFAEWLREIAEACRPPRIRLKEC